MSTVTKNIISILGLITVAFAGFYLYTQSTIPTSSADDLALQQMLSNTEVFIARSQELNSMRFDLSVLENERFRTLQTYTNPVESQPTGRANPFSAAGSQ
jgi:hypothetical protein